MMFPGRFCRLIKLAAAVALIFSGTSCTQTLRRLRGGPRPISIASPANGVTVRGGQKLRVEVAGSHRRDYDFIGLAFEGIPVAEIHDRLPAIFEVEIPIDASGPRNLVAFGGARPNTIAVTKPVKVNIKPAAPITSIFLGLGRVEFSYVGEEFFLEAEGRMADDELTGICGDPATTIRSFDERVALVTPDCRLTAMGPGMTYVEVERDGVIGRLPVRVKNGIRGDLDGDQDVDEDDRMVINERIQLGPPALRTAKDARDLNQNGEVEPSDIEELQRLCTRPRCRRY